MKKWDYLQLELTLIRCIFKRQWMFHLCYKADVAFHSSVKNPSKWHSSQAVPLQSSTDEPFPTWETCMYQLRIGNAQLKQRQNVIQRFDEERRITSLQCNSGMKATFILHSSPSHAGVCPAETSTPEHNTTQQEQVVHQPNIPSDAEQAANCPCQSTRRRADEYCSPENSRRVVHLLPLATALGHCPLCCLQG